MVISSVGVLTYYIYLMTFTPYMILVLHTSYFFILMCITIILHLTRLMFYTFYHGINSIALFKLLYPITVLIYQFYLKINISNFFCSLHSLFRCLYDIYFHIWGSIIESTFMQRYIVLPCLHGIWGIIGYHIYEMCEILGGVTKGFY